MKNQNQTYPECLDVAYTNATGSAIAAGAPVIVNGRWGVAFGPIANGESGVVKLGGVFTLAKAAGVAYAPGDGLYWDSTNARVTATPNGFKLGDCAEAAGTSDTTVRVMILPGNARVYTKSHAVSVAEDGANQIDFNLGADVEIANAVVLAQIRNTSGVQRVATITKNPGGSAPNTVRVADANLAATEVVEISIFV